MSDHAIQIQVELWPKTSGASPDDEPIKSWLWNGVVVPHVGDHFNGNLVTGVYWDGPTDRRHYPLTVTCEEPE